MEMGTIKDNDLEKYADKILEEGLQVLTTEGSELFSGDGGAKFADWLNHDPLAYLFTRISEL